MIVSELRGIQSFYAVQSVHTLMLGLKMLPSYLGESYEEFFARIDEMPEADQANMIREAALFVKLSPEEILDLCQFCSDANGVPYSKANMKSLRPEEIHEMIVAVGMQVMRDHKIKLITEAEKKN